MKQKLGDGMGWDGMEWDGAGTANTAGTFAGITSTVATGVLVDRFGSFQAVLRITAGIYFFGAAFWNLFATGERVFH